MPDPNAFSRRLVDDAAAMMQVVMASIGDRLGIWKDLAAHGPATSSELARRMGLSERHVREWLAAMTAASYLAYEPATKRFELPPGHVPALADETSAQFLGGMHQLLVAYLKPFDRIVETFRTGGGVPQSAYPDAAHEGQDRLTAPAYEHALVGKWLPAAGLVERLEAGIDVCDIGCGGGRALVKLAQTFPRSRFVGYDLFGPNVMRAKERAAHAGVNVEVKQLDVAAGMPTSFDLVTTFEVLHDAVDPRGILHAIRRALRPGGTYMCLEMKCAAALEDNVSPIGALLYGVSVMYCMATSLAHGGAGLGTCGLPHERLLALAADAGLPIRALPVEDLFTKLYVTT
jgi:SAM-dependent methyltransferase